MMHLRQQSAEYQLSIYPCNGSQYVRHRDAFPDDGSEDHQRRVHTCGHLKRVFPYVLELLFAVCLAVRVGFGRTKFTILTKTRILWLSE